MNETLADVLAILTSAAARTGEIEIGRARDLIAEARGQLTWCQCGTTWAILVLAPRWPNGTFWVSPPL